MRSSLVGLVLAGLVASPLSGQVLAAARLDRFGRRRDDAGLVRSEDGAEALRLKLASSRDSRKRVPEELRAEAAAFAKAKHALGRRYKSVASALGVKAETLVRWCRRRGTMCDVGAFEMQL